MNLPKGWIRVRFTDVLDVQGGTQPPKSQFIDEPKDGYIRLLQIRDFGKKPVPTYIPDTSKLKKVTFNDVLIGRYGASVGRICTGMEGAYNVALAKVLKSNDINSEYLRYYLLSSLFQIPLSLISRSAQNGFNKQDLAEIDFLLPPLNEQKRIAKKLDELLATVESIKTRLDNAPTILKRFRQSILAAATSGKLTEEWREENKCQSSKELLEKIISGRVEKYNLSVREAKKNGERKPQKQDGLEYPHISDEVDAPRQWEKAYLENVCDKIIDGTHKTPTYLDEGVHFLSAKNINNNKLDFKQTKYISIEEHEALSKRCKPIVGSLLLTKSGTIGRTAIVKTDKEFSLFESVAVITPSSDEIKSEYLQYVILNSMSNGILSKQVKGVAVQHLHLQDIRKIVFPLPLELEQKEIVSQVESLFALVDSMEAKIEAAQKRVDKLTQSILAKAFRGELVEQDPNDEPAEKLLEKIKAEQAKKKPKKTRKKK